VPEVRRNVCDHRSSVRSYEVVLLSVAVEQRRLRFWAADRRESLHEALDVSRKVYRQVSGVNG
jgi:hypothetical protein